MPVHVWTDKWIAPISSSLVQIIHTYVHAYIHQTHMPPPIKACDPFPPFLTTLPLLLPLDIARQFAVIYLFDTCLPLLPSPPPSLWLLPFSSSTIVSSSSSFIASLSSFSSSAASLSSFLFLLPFLVPPPPLSLMSFSSSLKHSTLVLTSMYWSYHITKMGSVPKTTILNSNNKSNTSKHILAKCIVVLLKMP